MPDRFKGMKEERLTDMENPMKLLIISKID